MGERLAAGKVDGWVTRNGARKRGVRVIHAEPRRRGGGAKAPVPAAQLTGRRPASWGWRSHPKSPAGLTTFRRKV